MSPEQHAAILAQIQAGIPVGTPQPPVPTDVTAPNPSEWMKRQPGPLPVPTKMDAASESLKGGWFNELTGNASTEPPVGQWKRSLDKAFPVPPGPFSKQIRHNELQQPVTAVSPPPEPSSVEKLKTMVTPAVLEQLRLRAQGAPR